ncbi:hypothetical protein ACSV5N_15065 [Agrobacterium salinitolerans]|uniref:hypothetical protein n=1 Tax=Agrobacterium salinitolerans TaxID=1183413 RepID=UPI001FDA8ABE|nr:hypothetical protein [Agrobacterium salinitolerans]
MTRWKSCCLGLMFIGNNRFSKGKIYASRSFPENYHIARASRPATNKSTCRSFIAFGVRSFRTQFLRKALLHPGQLRHQIVPFERGAGAARQIVMPSRQLREALIVGYPDLLVTVNFVYQPPERIDQIDQKLM